MCSTLCISDHGDVPLFKSLESQIVSGLPSSTCEWKRPLGRPLKNVCLQAAPVQFDAAALERYKKGNWNIIDFPVLHIFVSECVCVDIFSPALVPYDLITGLPFRTSTRTRAVSKRRSKSG